MFYNAGWHLENPQFLLLGLGQEVSQIQILV